jgi:hypothetical protein
MIPALDNRSDTTRFAPLLFEFHEPSSFSEHPHACLRPTVRSEIPDICALRSLIAAQDLIRETNLTKQLVTSDSIRIY